MYWKYYLIGLVSVFNINNDLRSQEQEHKVLRKGSIAYEVASFSTYGQHPHFDQHRDGLLLNYPGLGLCIEPIRINIKQFKIDRALTLNLPLSLSFGRGGDKSGFILNAPLLFCFNTGIASKLDTDKNRGLTTGIGVSFEDFYGWLSAANYVDSYFSYPSKLQIQSYFVFHCIGHRAKHPKNVFVHRIIYLKSGIDLINKNYSFSIGIGKRFGKIVRTE